MPIETPVPPPRCDDAGRRTAIEEAIALGVPRGYGRERRLRIVREPRALACIGTDVHGRPQWLALRAASAFGRMREAAAANGIALDIVSAFRSAEYQLGILRRKRERGIAIDEILRVSAAPGYSEHHSGRAVDLTTPGYAPVEEEFERSPAFAWLKRHASRFGFRLSYPRRNRHGIAYEPWHWCWHARKR
ncbi:MAG TPA: M15 family metallopeptidase [Rhodanobacteraceae bacterium]|jgi:D-alanyl-D-alanine carboxypeptidase|nr:M15 family metallopeptidase [Rhodanobacteraceae bacterium]